MDFTPSPAQHDLIARAAALAHDSLAKRAAMYDHAGTYPRESWHELWQHGFLAAAVPAKYGGLGLDMLSYVLMLEQLAQGCTNSTMTLHMHSVVQMYIDALATDEQKARFYPEVVDQGKLFGSWGSEPDRRGGASVGGTAIAPVNGGYVIEGEKHFCTMAGAAHRYMVHCAMQGIVSPQNLQLALVPHDHPGLTIAGEWDTLGMRATVSPSVTLAACDVAPDALLGNPGESLRSGVGLAFGVGYAAIYVGAAQQALDFTIDFCKTHRFEPDPASRAHDPIVQHLVAEMTMALEGARLVVYQSASQWERADAVRRAVLAARAKYVATEAALMVTSRAVQIVGGRSAHRRCPLERLFRDVRTATLMPPNVDRAMELVGKAMLDIRDDVLLARHAG
jgi:alkylation response protein AidB-like acyl-CoA dehydrogenase